jgi:hypothetical protein
MKIVGIVLAIMGIIGTAVSGTADYIGLNFTQDNPDVAAFGWLQILFVIIGVVIVIVGIVLFFVGSKKPKAEEVFVEEEKEEEIDQILDSFREEPATAPPAEGTMVTETTYQEDQAYEDPAAAFMVEEGTEPATVEEGTVEEEQQPAAGDEVEAVPQQPTETDATAQEGVTEEELFDV